MADVAGKPFMSQAKKCFSCTLLPNVRAPVRNCKYIQLAIMEVGLVSQLGPHIRSEGLDWRFRGFTSTVSGVHFTGVC